MRESGDGEQPWTPPPRRQIYVAAGVESSGIETQKSATTRKSPPTHANAVTAGG